MAHRRPLGTLRIIGGEFRSRLVQFDPNSGVRPTPDRVRQTLFDWLTPVVGGARCLDLFAGSGALGLEALSRGAAHVTFVEQSAGPCGRIRAALSVLRATERAEVRNEEALAFLSAAPRRYDIVFLDPPYDAGLLQPTLERLSAVLASEARVYAEWPEGQPPRWPARFAVRREKKAGQVSYALATYTGNEHDDRRGV